ncbi:MAG: thiamine pyrophosphate-binding protein [Burkholderiaceae bacterium]|jgi:benzoylformate decarboxylase|nr:thiamine pyrophosphate-binding protein [Burkholderiales bacterium]MCZ8103973.1 thiamine pyrophosphate-binding protein [Burkholderiales bacterium]MCZ8340239.1 thiamine pyrophosphate-binding protein [Burkholderiaceae bacterium]
MPRLSGRSAFLGLLEDEGITHLFGNPGTTELPIMHALPEHPGLAYVLGMQESVVVGMADGFGRASGRLVAANVHVAPGLCNAMGALYNAKFTGTPLLLTAGQQEQGHGLTEPLLYEPLVRIAEPLVKWAVEVNRLEDLPRIVRRAAKIATTPPTGPVFVSLPGDILNAEAELDLLASSRVETRVRPSDALVDALARRLLAAERPVMIVGDEVVKSDALDEAAAFARALGCAVWQQPVGNGAHFPSDHPCYRGTLPRAQPKVRETLAAHDLLVVVGADPLCMSVYSEVEPMPPGMPLVQVGLIERHVAKNWPVELAVLADVRETLRVLTPALEAAGGDAHAARARARVAALAADDWTRRREALVTTISRAAAHRPIDTDWAVLQTIDALPDDAILVDEALTASRHVPALLRYRERFGYHAMASGGIGWGLAASVGVSLAHPGRPVACLTGDGSAMYTIQALWTAAHHRLPLNVVLVNNGGYRIIKQRLLSFHGSRRFVGMDFADPPVDFSALAASMGVQSVRVDDPRAVRDVLADAFRRPGTKLIELMVDGSV